MEYLERLDFWFEMFETKGLKFKDLENKFHVNKQVSAIIFLMSKLKDKSEKHVLQGEHDTIYVGGGLDDFEEFNKKDVETLVYHGIYLPEDGCGFSVYASR